MATTVEALLSVDKAVVKLVAARDTAPPTIVNRYNRHTIVWMLAPNPNTMIVGFKLANEFVAGDIVEWFTSPGGTAVSAPFYDENDAQFNAGDRAAFIKMPDGKWYESV